MTEPARRPRVSIAELRRAYEPRWKINVTTTGYSFRRYSATLKREVGERTTAETLQELARKLRVADGH